MQNTGSVFDGECSLCRLIRLLGCGVLPLRQREAAQTLRGHKSRQTKVAPPSSTTLWCVMGRAKLL